MRDDDNPFLKILKAVEILQNEKEIFDREERKIISSAFSKKTIDLFQILALLAKKTEVTGVAMYLVNNHLRITNFLEAIEKMVQAYKDKEKGVLLMIYNCTIEKSIEKIISMIPASGQQLALFEAAFY